jgi:hypothetical protein
VPAVGVPAVGVPAVGVPAVGVCASAAGMGYEGNLAIGDWGRRPCCCG